MPSPSHKFLSRPIRAFAALMSVSCLASCGGVLDPQGPVGGAQRTMLFNSLAIMLCIVIPTIFLTLLFAWWFRASNSKARYRPDFVYSGQLEMVVWSIPAMVVLFLGGIAWIGSHELDPYRPLQSQNEPVEVQVVSLDWQWLFIYPAQNIAIVNELVIPANRPVRFRLTSATVMNAFFVPQLGSMIYTMNGMETRLHLQADQPGTFHGMSAHYSGEGFSDMHFPVRSMSQADFDQWIARTRDSSATLDKDSYGELVKPAPAKQTIGYKSVEPNLFDAIVANSAPIAPGASPRTQSTSQQTR